MFRWGWGRGTERPPTSTPVVLWSQSWAQGPPLPLTSRATLGKSLNILSCFLLELNAMVCVGTCHRLGGQYPTAVTIRYQIP